MLPRNNLSFGSFGPIASQRQGSPKGTNMAPAPSLGGTVRPPTTINNTPPGGTLGNISAGLPRSGAVQTNSKSALPPSNAVAATTPKVSKVGPRWSVVVAGLAVAVILYLVVKM